MKQTINEDSLNIAKRRYRDFIDVCSTSNGMFRLTPNAEPTAYALCFAIFGLWLIQDLKTIQSRKRLWNGILRKSLDDFHIQRSMRYNLHQDKPYLQLLTFTLSALSLLGTLKDDPLSEHVEPMIQIELADALNAVGTFEGKPQSGNHAMFLAILLLHAKKYLLMKTQPTIDLWIDLHIEHMNRFGFWGIQTSMSHLQFQNGYHQYEILEYVNVESPRAEFAADSVASLADKLGHFAPYPGGGGCYDYDAVSIITSAGSEIVKKHRDLLLRTAATILSEQNPDGGFAESQYVRPRSVANLLRMLRHVSSTNKLVLKERARYVATLLRPKHDRIRTHWSLYSRLWPESDLWDSWFRMLTIARIQTALSPDSIKQWGFIGYPGLGYHPLLHPKI